MKARVTSVGGVASRVVLGEHVLTFDQPESVPGGQDRGPSPLDVMAASVGACAHYFASAYLFARKLDTDDLVVEVEAEKAREPSPRFGSVRLRVVLPSGLRPEQRTAIERVVKSCPAYGTLVEGTEVTLVVEERPSAAA